MKSKATKVTRRIVKVILPAAAASQGMQDPEVQLELMRHRILHQLPKQSLIKQLLEK